MTLTIDLADPLDIQAGYAIILQHLPQQSQGVTSPTPLPTPSPAGLAAQRFIDALWPHLGQSMRRLVKEAAKQTSQQPMITIATLAAALGRPEKSVRASMNGPLAIAIKNVKLTMASAPDLFVWQHNGTVFELGMTVEIRAALDTKPVF